MHGKKKWSGIEKIEDLKGKRVAVGDQNSGVEINARQLLEGVGITYDNLKVDYLGYAEDMAEEQEIMTMQKWIETADKLLEFRNKKILKDL